MFRVVRQPDENTRPGLVTIFASSTMLLSNIILLDAESTLDVNHMSTSSDDESNDHPLTLSSYSMNVLNDRASQYHDGIKDANTGHVTSNLSFNPSEHQNPQAQEEGLLITPFNSLIPHRQTSKNSTVRVYHGLLDWVKGPQPPRAFKIQPILPQLQKAPLVVLHKYFPSRRQKRWLLIVSYVLWIALFLSVLFSSVSGCQLSGYESPLRLSCVSRLW